MRKRSKLTEKGVRFPNLREHDIESAFREYLPIPSELNEPARTHRFTILLHRLFGETPQFIEEYMEGIQRYVRIKGKDLLQRGYVDNLFGNLVIEFERKLDLAHIREAESQLKRYVTFLWTNEPIDQRRTYICIATDGDKFQVYLPKLKGAPTAITEDDVVLEQVETFTLSELSPIDAYITLDRYFVRREILHPTTESIVKDFGLNSIAFKAISVDLMEGWQQVKPEFAVVYDQWSRYLRVVYGTDVADEELFIRHTYLATLAKLMVWMRLNPNKSELQVEEIFDGSYFSRHGLENFMDEDFFSWIGRSTGIVIGNKITSRLLSLLYNYNLRELSEDIFKALYQQLVDPQARHDLGEFYTPDWLAAKIVRKFIDKNPKGKFLDPACGSGTFLYMAIRAKRERLGDTQHTLYHILDTVAGIDVHPLAVIIARANYFLALGDLVQKRGNRRLHIPVYLADTIKLPEPEIHYKIAHARYGLDMYEVDIDGDKVLIPERLVNQPVLLDEAIDACRSFAKYYVNKKPTMEIFYNYLRERHTNLAEDKIVMELLYKLADKLRHLMENKRDSIWAFILKNIFKPVFLKDKFDFIVGNPPWLSYRYIQQPEYQAFVKKLICEDYELLKGRGELITQMELATLFLLRAADLYLKSGGEIGFVLTRAIYSGDQHHEFRQGRFRRPKLSITEIWDLENVTPLFKMPACVVFARKGEEPQHPYPVEAKIFKGELPRHNANECEADSELNVKTDKIYLSLLGKRSYWSYGKQVELISENIYAERIHEGATIVPRPFWFIKVEVTPHGFNPELPPIITTDEPDVAGDFKSPYDRIRIKGNVESKFIFATLLSKDLVPFGYTRLRMVVLPVIKENGKWKIITADEAEGMGYLGLADWLHKVETVWERLRGVKAERMSIYERLDRYKGLTQQSPSVKYRVVYNTSGTYLTAAVVENKPVEFKCGAQKLQVNGIFIDCTNYCCEIDNVEEAHYLVAVLNSPTVNEAMKPIQARGLYGPRHIHKKVMEFPMPRYNPNNEIHRKLAEMSKLCEVKVNRWLQEHAGDRLGWRLRGKIREFLAEEITQIDELVTKL